MYLCRISCVKLLTTSIGSLPRLHEDLGKAISLAVDLQLELGLDILTDGEQRTDMITYLADAFEGLAGEPGRLHIVDKLKPARKVEETFKVRDFLAAFSHLRKQGEEKPIKVGVTGPVTFAFTVAMNGKGPYRSLADPSLYLDAAEGVNRVAAELQSRSAIVQIDEPGISAGFVNPKLAEEAVNTATDGLEPWLTAIHVCGRLRERTLRHILRLKNVEVVSLEFAGSPSNLDMLSLIAASGKKLGVGCMKVNVSSEAEITTPDEAADIIRRVLKTVGVSRLAYIHPDCGLRRTSPSLARKILEQLVALSASFKQSVSHV